MSEAKNSPDASTNHDSEDLWAEALEQQKSGIRLSWCTGFRQL